MVWYVSSGMVIYEALSPRIGSLACKKVSEGDSAFRFVRCLFFTSLGNMNPKLVIPVLSLGDLTM